MCSMFGVLYFNIVREKGCKLHTISCCKSMLVFNLCCSMKWCCSQYLQIVCIFDIVHVFPSCEIKGKCVVINVLVLVLIIDTKMSQTGWMHNQCFMR